MGSRNDGTVAVYPFLTWLIKPSVLRYFTAISRAGARRYRDRSRKVRQRSERGGGGRVTVRKYTAIRKWIEMIRRSRETQVFPASPQVVATELNDSSRDDLGTGRYGGRRKRLALAEPREEVGSRFAAGQTVNVRSKAEGTFAAIRNDRGVYSKLNDSARNKYCSPRQFSIGYGNWMLE